VAEHVARGAIDNLTPPGVLDNYSGG